MFNGLNIHQHSHNNKGLDAAFPDWPVDELHFLEQSLQLDPGHRPAASTLLEMSFFTHDHFNVTYPMQIKAKIQQEFQPVGNHNEDNNLPLTNMINTTMSEKRMLDDTSNRQIKVP